MSDLVMYVIVAGALCMLVACTVLTRVLVAKLDVEARKSGEHGIAGICTGRRNK